MVGNRLKTVLPLVNIRQIELNAHAHGIFKQHFELIGVIHLHRHIGAEKFGGVMHLNPCRVVGQQRIGGSVRLVKAVAREFFHQVENLIRLGFADAIFGGSGAEDAAMLCHFFRLFLTHRPPQHIRTTQRVAAQNLRGLHHLLLVHHDAVGFGQHIRHEGMGVFDFLPPMFTRHKAGNQIHRARAVKRIQGD